MSSVVTRALRRAKAWLSDPRQGSLFDGDGDDGGNADGDVRPLATATVQAAPVAAIAAVAADTPDTASDASSRRAHTHPRSNRHTVLDGHVVGYAFARARRRSIGMSVGPEGLAVRAPRWVSLREVEEALQERAAWIVRHLQTQQQRALERRAKRLVWGEGTVVPYLGHAFVIALDEASKAPRLDTESLFESCGSGALGGGAAASGSWAGSMPAWRLVLPLPSDASAITIRTHAQRWLQAQARVMFEERIAHFAPTLRVSVTRLTLGSARTRWGSAGADGSVRLNWRLVHQSLSCIDYVVVHELAHLRHMNHGKAFWRLVESVLPDWRAARDALKDEPLGLHDED
jgi:predicted metal-dependent hydrolase